MKRALVVGISGFVGSHLAHYLMDEGWGVLGFDHHSITGFDVQTGDLLDQTRVEQVILEARPEFIFLLAGVLKSDHPEQFYTAHVLGTVTLLDAVLKSDLWPVVIVASSSAVYGAGAGKKPINENFKPHPVTHYAVSKLAQEMVVLRYWAASRLPVIRVRTFNLLGPGLSPVLACSDFARQIAQAEKQGRASTISTGDLSARRDFVDVRDAARAYALLAEKGRAGQVYNVASGRPVAIRECLDFLRKQARVPIEVVMDPARMQRNDVPIQIGSAKRLHDVTGWEIKISVEQSLLDLLEDWRRKVV